MKSISLGYAIVAGRKRVPRVAAGITAFTDPHHASHSSSSPSALLVAPRGAPFSSVEHTVERNSRRGLLRPAW